MFLLLPRTGNSAPAAVLIALIGTEACAVAQGPDAEPVAVAVAAGQFHSCALVSDGTVWCWGSGERGRLGNTASVPREEFGIPRARRPMQAAVAEARALFAGYANTCILRREDSALLCWGGNDFDQLGVTGVTYLLEPRVLFSGRSVTHASAGLGMICAVLETGAVECTGNDESYAISGSRRLAEPAYPSRYRQVFAGTVGVCAVSEDGEAYCWGGNRYGELDVAAGQRIKRPFLRADSVTSIAIGRTFSCAVRLDKRVTCWGRDHLGAPLDTARSGVAQHVSAVALGTLASWVLTDDGKVRAFQPGRAIGSPGSPPILPAPKAAALVAGFNHACLLVRDATIWCWGSNLDGEVGSGERSSSSSPVRVFP
jgi:alpha-tubulin suppressor-like RCC1 family protein